MNEIQLTDHLVAHISAGSDYGRYQAKICEDGDFRDYLYAMSLKRLKRKCERYAKRERKAIAYVATPEYTAKLLGVPLDEVLYIIAHPETPAPHKDDFTPEFIEPLI